MSSTSTIDFNEAAGNALERAYLTSDVIDQRAAVLRALDLKPDEHVLDVGPGWSAFAGRGPGGLASRSGSIRTNLILALQYDWKLH